MRRRTALTRLPSFGAISLPRGGTRTHSGPPPVEGSRTSERKGYSLTALPPTGYDGDVPELSAYLPGASTRHQALWAEHWTYPQACAWSTDRTYWPMLAELVNWIVRGEAEDAPVGAAANVSRLRIEVGIGASGLKHNGWKIADAPTPAADDASLSNVTDIKSRLAGGA